MSLSRSCSWHKLIFVLLLGFSPSLLAQDVKSPPQKRKVKTPAKPKSSLTKAEGSVIVDIQVAGQKRLEKEAILNRVSSEMGQPLSQEKVRQDILALFDTGFFETIDVSFSAGILTYTVSEKPVLADLTFEGNKELKSDELQEATGFKTFEIFNQAKLRDATDKILKLYEDKGYYLAKVEPKVSPLDTPDRVSLSFKITENEKVKVKKIHFIGNQKLSDEYLKARLMTREEGYFSAMSGSGQFKQDAFERDTQILRFLYYNLGYVKARVDRPSVTLTPDRLGLYITFRLEEGEQYNVGTVEFAGDLLFSNEKLLETTKIDNNGVFAYDVLQKDLSDLQALYGDLGYAYANVIPRHRFNDKDKIADLVFEFSKGEKVKFGRITVVGNSKSRDKVLRRELKIKEGELYHETRRRQSVENIQRLGFFEEVNFKTSSPVDRPNTMDIEIVVKERNTGQIQIGAGYSSNDGFTLQGSVQQTNFRGLGQNLGVSLQMSDDSNQYDMSFTEPYYNDTDWSMGGRVFRSEISGRADYREYKTGGSLFASHPIGEFLRAGASYTYTATRLKVAKDRNNNVLTDLDLFPLDTASGDSGLVGFSLEYDTRNDRWRPNKGIYSKLSYSHAGLLGGNLSYYRAGADYRFFKNLFWDVTWRNSLSYARIESTEGGKDVPFNELFVLGGPYTLRGFEYGSVGRRVKSNKIYDESIAKGDPPERANILSKRVFGGEQQVLYQTELMFPLIREADMFGVGFYDVGIAEDDLVDRDVFSNWGFGIRWFSPLGPLRFEWGFPIKRNHVYHEASVFEFSIGTPF